MGLYIIAILIFIVCILMILIVLAQNSKGGGLTSTFSGGNQVMGVKKTSDFLEKATWTLALAMLVLSLSTVFVMDQNVSTGAPSETSELEYIRNNENAKPVEFQPTTEKAATSSDESAALPTE
ncbi:MAG: preprotein translocase subunit SecG [Bacteroidetes bacterium 4572_112]|nr:MAG: preprotein translocase subunit SecG [Bacteroidetes bacterium 4572_112]